MNNEEVLDYLKNKRLCHRCVGEVYLSDEMVRLGDRRRCSFCQRMEKSYAVGQMAKRIEQAFAEHYIRTSNHPIRLERVDLKSTESERDGEPVVRAIKNAAHLPPDAAQNIQTILDMKYRDVGSLTTGTETEFCSECYYKRKVINDLAEQAAWRRFEQSLKVEARFFNREAATYLESLFNQIESMSTIDGRRLVIEAGPGTSVSNVYRARSFQSNDELKTALCRPDQQLGPPPASVAKAGRMNAAGITVFYGSTERGTAITEVRPPVGSHVAVARFEIIRRLRLLDLTALSAVDESGSIFDTSFTDRVGHARFLRSLAQRITQPVMPDDAAFDYIPTQAIADFLATESKPPIDGIVFSSAQTTSNAQNVVLFNKAARVEAIRVPRNVRIEVTDIQLDEDSLETEYQVIERVSPAPVNDKTQEGVRRPNFPAIELDGWPSDDDSRELTLRIDPSSIEVHLVRGVGLKTIEHEVSRHQQVGDSPLLRKID